MPIDIEAYTRRHRRGAGLGGRVVPALTLGVPVAASLVVLFTVSQRELPEESGPQSTGLAESTRVKGDPRLLIHRQRAGGATRLTGADRARPGDVLQLGYNAAGRRYGAVLSLDGRGGVTLHQPESPEGPLELAGGSATLAHAYALDDAPGFERFILVTSDAPFELREVLDSARALAHDPDVARGAPLPLPGSFDQTSVTLEKAP
ncbi:ActD-like protein [Myxococcaceae bacterium GXIMD 01537]